MSRVGKNPVKLVDGVTAEVNGLYETNGDVEAAITLLRKKGEVDAVAVFSDDKAGKKSALVKYAKNPQFSKQTAILWVSEPIPNEPFTVRQDFYAWL